MIDHKWKNLGNFDLFEKLKKLKVPIRKWNKEMFGDIDNNIAKLENELTMVENRLDQQNINEVDMAHFQELRSVLDSWYKRRSSYWKQLSRKSYLKDMDKNYSCYYYYKEEEEDDARNLKKEVSCSRSKKNQIRSSGIL